MRRSRAAASLIEKLDKDKVWMGFASFSSIIILTAFCCLGHRGKNLQDQNLLGAHHHHLLQMNILWIFNIPEKTEDEQGNQEQEKDNGEVSGEDEKAEEDPLPYPEEEVEALKALPVRKGACVLY